MNKLEALSLVKKEWSKESLKPIREALLVLVPSLEDCEDEDEIHRKWILEYLYDGLRKADEQFKDHFKAAIDWLEKQKEYIEDIRQYAYNKGLVDAEEKQKEPRDYRKLYEEVVKSDWFKENYVGKSLGEDHQSAEWSEEDKENIKLIATHLDNLGNTAMAEILRNLCP